MNGKTDQTGGGLEWTGRCPFPFSSIGSPLRFLHPPFQSFPKLSSSNPPFSLCISQPIRTVLFQNRSLFAQDGFSSLFGLFIWMILSHLKKSKTTHWQFFFDHLNSFAFCLQMVFMVIILVFINLKILKNANLPILKLDGTEVANKRYSTNENCILFIFWLFFSLK